MCSPQFSPSVLCCTTNSVRPSSSLRARIRVSTSPTRIEGFDESQPPLVGSAGKLRPRGRIRSSQLVGDALASPSIMSIGSDSSWSANSIRPSSSGRALTRARRSLAWSCATRSPDNTAQRPATRAAISNLVIGISNSVLRLSAGKSIALTRWSAFARVTYAVTAALTLAGRREVKTFYGFSDHLFEDCGGWADFV